eukprot:TRINITY_DN1248_c0_g4_i1.p1 TRINITY_DN1248_c0_g4~~TRINITY_DN1248_c0_g4_i1.p1  ORF type:complete len:178 (+),score=23.70 TRINITY_DN1248_c0_g4_i1:73-606(+)
MCIRDRYSTMDLLRRRLQVSSVIKKELQERAKLFYIIIDDSSITNLSFSDEFLAAIEAKQVAKQNAEGAKYLLALEIYKKKSAIIKAEGEAISAQLIGKSMNSAYLELKCARTARKIAKVLSNAENTVFVDTKTLLLSITSLLGHELLELGNREEGKFCCFKRVKNTPAYKVLYSPT